MCLLAMSATAAEWSVSTNITDGMTGPQQITNALMRLSSGDTILVEPGIYDFSGISMRTDEFEKDGKTYVITNHLKRDIAFALKGNTSGHWDDTVIFKGDGRFLDAKYTSKKLTIANISFDGFNCGDFPSGGSFESRGGCLRLDNWTTTLTQMATNCVFRNCKANVAGAVNAGWMVDCLATNNYATQFGGVGSNSRFERCRIMYNRVGGSYGGSWNHFGCFDSYFEGNAAVNGGALLQGSLQNCSNCTFVANVARENGGAVYIEAASDTKILDCTFIGNVATNSGGAIGSATKGYTKIHGCTFISNTVARAYDTADTYGGGAIHCRVSLPENTISNCTFFGNWTIGTYGGAVVNGVCEDCTFVSNRTENIGGGACYFYNTTGAVLRCVFLDNMATNVPTSSGDGGGALRVKSGNRTAVIDCSFTNNFTTANGGAVWGGAACTNCTFTDNYTLNYGGAVYGSATCANCTFSDNKAIYRGGAIHGAEAVDCVFRGNRKGDRAGKNTHYEYGGGCAYNSRLVRCDTTDAAFWQCSLTDCSIHDVVDSIAPCIFYEENWATNCLVSGSTSLSYGLFYRYLWRPGTASDYRGAKRGAMVNCTFVDNSVNRAETFYVNNSHKTNEFDFVNCIFHNNKVNGGAVADLSGALVVGVTLQNCIYGVSNGTLSWEDKGGNIECADPKFAKDLQNGRYPYYMPKSNSLAINAGLTADWMSTATDLSGTNRVLGASVDIGCYESYIPFFGTAILFR